MELKELIDSEGRCVIPECVKEIEECAFEGCSGPHSVLVPDSVENIGSSVFSGCTALNDDDIPKDGRGKFADLPF